MMNGEPVMTTVPDPETSTSSMLASTQEGAAKAVHPAWCISAACKAFDPEGDERHRSESIRVPIGEPGVALNITKVADPDGSDVQVELVVLYGAGEDAKPADDSDILIAAGCVDGLRFALAELA